ncbi:SDR family oxidoreductase [Anaerorhabdus furcosa]|uniref:NAD(P)-dependent dehydrogenase, short-chain alcohol dehydrogenase family n=1 Tax=Anaerorhabdus furcosa TaxID=118967 RepID=A0A1T4MP57_9FIRM|nr:SDR family oxidoreductase [Anaerorhabdus furcosa]SJZ68508.1 NAD(P)-dependent dehydrogenase, short-chain alcohol dehydrogenase family [Anaerorhabdus furcosa]
MIPFEIDLKNKVVVITGAGGIICNAFAKAIAKTGAKIALLDINEEAIMQLENEILKEKGIAKAYKCNVLSSESLRNIHDKIKNDLGACDVLINGAGGNNSKATTDDEYYDRNNLNEIKTFYDLDEEGIRFVFDLNFMGTLLPTQIFSKDMIGKKGCSIINISSMNAYTPLTKIPAYSAAKAGISNFTQWLAVYFKNENIRCNAIAPGFFVTKQNEKMLFNQMGEPTERTKKILNNTPMNRFGNIDELIGTLFYLLCEDASSFVTGIVIPVDGGFSAYSGV